MNKIILSRTFTKKIATPVVNAWNEWDPLEEIIVGIPYNAAVPPLTIETKPCIDSSMWSFFQANRGKLWSDAVGKEFWSNIISEHNEFVDVLRKEGVIVRYPEPQQFTEKYKIPNHETSGMYCAMPRDIILPVGDEIIEAPMTWRSRYFEINAYRKLLINYWNKGASWIAAPKPTYSNLFEEISDASNKFVTNETEPTFDAADFIRAGCDIFAQRSQVTNKKGIQWVRNHLKNKGIRVIILSFDQPRPMHIDASLLPIKPGIMLGNPDRKCHQLHHILGAGWKVIYAAPRKHKNHHPYYLASPWITMNVLMINENTVIVEAADVEMQHLFKTLDMKVIPVKFRHCNSIGGGFHCWTVDIRRQGELRSYFNWNPEFIDEQFKES